MEQFRLAWAELRKDRPPRQGINHVGKAKNITRMRACLAEAFRCHHRDFVRELRSPSCWSLKRDESKHRLCLLFRGVNNELEVHEAVIGWERCDVTDSVTKTHQTDAAFKLVSTPFIGHNKLGEMDEAIYGKLTSLMEYMVTDAASSDVLSVINDASW